MACVANGRKREKKVKNVSALKSLLNVAQLVIDTPNQLNGPFGPAPGLQQRRPPPHPYASLSFVVQAVFLRCHLEIALQQTRKNSDRYEKNQKHHSESQWTECASRSREKGSHHVLKNFFKLSADTFKQEMQHITLHAILTLHMFIAGQSETPYGPKIKKCDVRDATKGPLYTPGRLACST